MGTKHVLLVESDQGWWGGEDLWVETWGEAVQFEEGADCLDAAEEVERRTGVKCRIAYL
jgi:hypothetical protein